MKILLIDTSVLLKKGTTVNVHELNCREIIKHLNKAGHYTKFYHSNEPAFNEKEQFDIILVSYASFYFDFPKFVRLINNQQNCRIGWMTNDYNLSANSSLAKLFDFVISNFEDLTGKWSKLDYCFTNLNSLVMRRPSTKIKKKYNAIYYGTYRKEREPYFRKYFKEPLIVSCSPKNVKKFLSLGVRPRFMGKMVWRQNAETLSLFKKSLYIEDVPTHKQYSHLANRFYESLMSNTYPIFDKSCINTINKSGYNIPEEYIISSPEELNRDLDAFVNEDDLLNWQEQALEEKKKTLKDINRFLCAL